MTKFGSVPRSRITAQWFFVYQTPNYDPHRLFVAHKILFEPHTLHTTIHTGILPLARPWPVLYLLPFHFSLFLRFLFPISLFALFTNFNLSSLSTRRFSTSDHNTTVDDNRRAIGFISARVKYRILNNALFLCFCTSPLIPATLSSLYAIPFLTCRIFFHLHLHLHLHPILLLPSCLYHHQHLATFHLRPNNAFTLKSIRHLSHTLILTPSALLRSVSSLSRLHSRTLPQPFPRQHHFFPLSQQNSRFHQPTHLQQRQPRHQHCDHKQHQKYLNNHHWPRHNQLSKTDNLPLACNTRSLHMFQTHSLAPSQSLNSVPQPPPPRQHHRCRRHYNNYQIFFTLINLLATIHVSRHNHHNNSRRHHHPHHHLGYNHHTSGIVISHESFPHRQRSMPTFHILKHVLPSSFPVYHFLLHRDQSHRHCDKLPLLYQCQNWHKFLIQQ